MIIRQSKIQEFTNLHHLMRATVPVFVFIPSRIVPVRYRMQYTYPPWG